MKIIFKIAKNEVRNLVYSPVAWFLVIVFLVQCAIFYAEPITMGSMLQEILSKNNPKFKQFPSALTAPLFLSETGVFAKALQNLFLFIPLLTMGILSREVNSGTIKLLYSSPIRLRDLVLGKYLALMCYSLVLVGILCIFMVSGAFQIKSIDYPVLLSATLGFYLLACAYSAIGLFMSSLSNYQIISAIGTFMVLFILGRIGGFWQQYDFVRDLTYFLSIAGRTAKMMAGLITTKDVIYFVVVVYMFLGFTLFKLKGGREAKPWTIKALRYIGVVISGVLIGYVSSRPALTGYLDVTVGKINTIHPRSQKILARMGDNAPLEVTLYTNLLGSGAQRGMPVGRNPYLTTLWESFLRFKPDIQFKYVYYYYNDGSLDNRQYYKAYPGKTEKQIAGITAKQINVDSAMFMPPAEIRKIIDPNLENGRVFMQLRYKDKKVNLRTFDDSYFWPDETHVDDALKLLIGDKGPKIYFLSGNLERSIHKTGEREYSGIAIDKGSRNALINHGFDTDTLSLDSRDIPADADILVIADPKTNLSQATEEKVEQYIDKGGNLLIFGEPRKQGVLNPLLGHLGVQFRNGTLVELSKNETPDKVIPYVTATGANLAEESKLLQWKEALRKKATEDDTVTVPMPGAMALSYAINGPFTISPLLETRPNKTWLKIGSMVLDSVAPVFNPREGDVKASSFITAVQLTRQINNKQQRIIVCGDADFTSNMRMTNNSFRNAFYSWMAYGIYPQYLPRRIDVKDNLLLISHRTGKTLKIIYIWVLPGLLLLGGGLLLIRRKRK
ncbi:ABC-2 type transport system permease protein [Pedobacter africanus]|uniref:ABC-2 type transport system permease protein n=1 Tax=Pedobacter africanus TaxID=151894 RepID=A0ACC6L3Y0_9SPHI|nr:Gldg family protein [Pedobacter africanus]MDR6786107.1 ABC-2 type transport system permease protein [Pedobacter africanus]